MLRPYRVSDPCPSRSVPRQCGIHVHGPRVDSTPQAPHFRKARGLEDLERLERARAVVAVRHDLVVTVQLSQPIRQLDRKSTRLNSSHGYISYAVFCLKKKKK